MSGNVCSLSSHCIVPSFAFRTVLTGQITIKAKALLLLCNSHRYGVRIVFRIMLIKSTLAVGCLFNVLYHQIPAVL